MLQLPQTKRPNVAPKGRATVARPKKSATSIIRADIQPIGEDPDLLNQLRYMSERNDIDGMVVLYDAYSSAAQGFLLIQNQPRVSEAADDFIELEYCQMWAKAYLVADFLKDLRPDHHRAERYARVLFDCAFQMGSSLTEVAAIIQEIATMPECRPETPQS
jgi:hypothetical protein